MSVTKSAIKPWLLWFLVASVYFIQYGLLIYPEVAGQAMQLSLKLSSFQIGMLSSAFLYTYTALQIPGGIMLDKFGGKKIFIAAIILIILGCTLFVVANHYALVFIARMIMGIGGGVSFITTLYLSRNWFDINEFPLVIGLTEAMSGLGAMTFTAVFGYLIQLYTWQAPIHITIFALLIILLLSFIFIKDRKALLLKQDDIEQKNHVWSLFNNKLLWLLGFYVFFGFAHFMVMTNMWAVPMLEQIYHIHSLEAILINSFAISGFTIGGVAYGLLCRRFQGRYLLLLSSISVFILVSVTVFVKIDLVMNAILLLAIGILTGNLVVSFNIVKKTIILQHQGFAFGFVNMFFGLPGVILTPVISYLLQKTDLNIKLVQLPILGSLFIAFLLSIWINFAMTRKHDLIKVEAAAE